MRKMITLSLPTEVVDEILNNLEDGLEVWRNTEEYLASGSIVASCIIAKCSNVCKAHRMVKLYEKAISTVETIVKQYKDFEKCE